MIIKAYHDDGRPDLGRWLVTCDINSCTNTALLIHSVDWLVPMGACDLDMPSYCSACLAWEAHTLISTALRCPGCASTDLDFCHNPHICCGHCGASLWSYTVEAEAPGLINGWAPPADGGWST